MLTTVLRAIHPAQPRSRAELSIGSDDSTLFSCPTCARPLASETTRCPSCGTRLLLGVPTERAAVFLTVGLAAGLLTGGTIAGIAVSGSRPAPIAAVTRTTTQAGPVDESGGSAGAPVSIPSASLAALQQSAVINGRLAAGMTTLQTELSAKPFDAPAVATTLRDLAADATVAADSTARVGDWPAAGTLAIQLSSFYESVRGTAREGLDNTIWNEAAYKSAGTKMIQVLGGLNQLNQATQQLAANAGVTVAAYGAR